MREQESVVGIADARSVESRAVPDKLCSLREYAERYLDEILGRFGLTACTRRVATKLFGAASNSEAAAALAKAVDTVRAHRRLIYERLEVHDQGELVLRLAEELWDHHLPAWTGPFSRDVARPTGASSPKRLFLADHGPGSVAPQEPAQGETHMIFGTTIIHDGTGTTPYLTPPFPRGGVGALFSLNVTHEGGTPEMVIAVQHKNADETEAGWTTLGSFSTITATGVKTKDLEGFKEQVRFSITFSAGSLGEFFHVVFAAPAWRPN